MKPESEVSAQISSEANFQPVTQVRTDVKTQTQLEPVPELPAQVVVAVIPKDKRRHFLAVFFLSFMWGTFGVDRFYLGKYGTGFLKLITLGGFGLWTLIDLSLVMSGTMRDRQGNEMLEFKRYKKFASRTVMIFTLAILAIFTMTAVSLVLTIMQLFQNGGLQQLMPSGGQIPSADQLQSLMGIPAL